MSVHADDPAVTRPLDASTLAAWPLPAHADGDKKQRGTVLVIGGSPVTVGAVLLAGLAALRMGAGRLQLATEAASRPHLGIAVPEALVLGLDADEEGGLLADPAQGRLWSCLAGASSVLFGVGMVGRAAAARLLGEVVQRMDPAATLVLDALGLACLRDLPPEHRDALRGRLALTPNDEELALLEPLGADPNLGRADRVRHIAHDLGALVSCFGCVAAPDGTIWQAEASCPGLGTSGSGDVLAGLVVGAAARADDLVQAGCWATAVHLDAGAYLSARCGGLGFLARELLDAVPTVMQRLADAGS